ncbi:glycosyltransferase family 2 protein [Nesterenkonia pannonica]|uniref:glycosyltransferase family 2 protein n=1 Tax=Nesterenkonia pannonica TaxID=1548602 RepID=UPI0021648879|nr:glycosyltransferase family A protein [Nesterenkonia pannonica]
MTKHTDTPVTAIIVSTGWLGLKNAVQSVTRQTIPVTPLIVLDKPQAETSIRRRLAGLHYRLITTRGEEGLAASRNIGVEAATTEYVAFLDERDAWVSHKTHTQLDALRQATATWGTTVISSRSLRVQQTSRITPERLYVPGTPSATTSWTAPPSGSDDA